MAELLIELVGQTDTHPQLDAMLPKQGDVLFVHSHADSWGMKYLNDPTVLILPVNMTAEEAWEWMGAAPLDVDLAPSPSYRQKYVDVTQLRDGMTVGELRAITTLRPQIIVHTHFLPAS